MSIQPIETVVVHPLVLLSVVDHYNRIDKVSSQKRVVGILLGSRRKGSYCYVLCVMWLGSSVLDLKDCLSVF